MDKLKFGDLNKKSIKNRLRELRHIMNANEKLIGVLYVFDDKARDGGFFVTDTRVITICQAFAYGTKSEDFPYKKISSIELKTSFLKTKIIIHVSGNSSEYQAIDKELTKRVVSFIREKMVEQPKPTPVAETPAVEDDDIFAKIEKLAVFREKGILTEEEFERKKSELLSKI